MPGRETENDRRLREKKVELPSLEEAAGLLYSLFSTVPKSDSFIYQSPIAPYLQELLNNKTLFPNPIQQCIYKTSTDDSNTSYWKLNWGAKPIKTDQYAPDSPLIWQERVDEHADELVILTLGNEFFALGPQTDIIFATNNGSDLRVYTCEKNTHYQSKYQNVPFEKIDSWEKPELQKLLSYKPDYGAGIRISYYQGQLSYQSPNCYELFAALQTHHLTLSEVLKNMKIAAQKHS